MAVLLTWCTTPVPMCQSNDLQLEVQKRCSFLKNVALLWILCMWLYSTQHAISLPLWIKLTMVQLLLLFLYNFSYARGVLASK